MPDTPTRLTPEETAERAASLLRSTRDILCAWGSDDREVTLTIMKGSGMAAAGLRRFLERLVLKEGAIPPAGVETSRNGRLRGTVRAFWYHHT